MESSGSLSRALRELDVERSRPKLRYKIKPTTAIIPRISGIARPRSCHRCPDPTADFAGSEVSGFRASRLNYCRCQRAPANCKSESKTDIGRPITQYCASHIILDNYVVDGSTSPTDGVLSAPTDKFFRPTAGKYILSAANTVGITTMTIVARIFDIVCTRHHQLIQ